MDIALIAAFDEKQLIGNGHKLPWSIPKDLQYFKKTTLHHPIVMGRKTYESIGKPLPNRTNIVISRTLSPKPGIIVLSDPEQLYSLKYEKVFIIGGAKIYQYFLPQTKYLYITHIAGNYTGDTFFPPLSWDQWETISEENDPPCTFSIYRRR